MTVSNKLTVLRIILVPVFVVLMSFNSAKADVWACVVFAAACITDWLDGYLARSRNEVTNFGKFADPIADKILVFAAYLCLTESGTVPAWAVIVVLMREFIVSALRMIAAAANRVIAADKLGKLKTVSQMISTIMIILGRQVYMTDYVIYGMTAMSLFYISVLLAAVSGVNYVVKYKDLLKG